MLSLLTARTDPLAVRVRVRGASVAHAQQINTKTANQYCIIHIAVIAALERMRERGSMRRRIRAARRRNQTATISSDRPDGKGFVTGFYSGAENLDFWIDRSTQRDTHRSVLTDNND